MKIATGRALDRLCLEEPCLGAVFTSFGFDPAFFEDQVLRAVLRLTSDPVEQPQRYYGEALRTLQETPVCVIVDAGQRQPGRRLPYDLLEVSKVVFHPKSVLLLFDEQARLMIGSGNLTSTGYSQNTELFLTLDLRYDDGEGLSILRQFDEHLSQLIGMTRQKGSQLSLLREELRRRVGDVDAVKPSSNFALLDSTNAPLLDQVSKLLPADAAIESIGMLAPFYERDDAGELDTNSVFGALGVQPEDKVTLDVGVAWDNAQVYRESHPVKLNDGLNQLWAWASEGESGREVEYMVPSSVGPSKLVFSDQRGNRKLWDVEEAKEDVEEGNLWMLPKPIAYAPRQALKSASQIYGNVRVWLHPATRLLSGRPVHRPLHAKLLTICHRDGASNRTLVVMGSANMSRRALLQQAGAGNVELVIAFVLDGQFSLADFLPDLVCVPDKLLELNEREFPELGPNWALAIDTAIHDPKRETLKVTWNTCASELPGWRLAYKSKELAISAAPPESTIQINDFVLQPSTAELVLKVDEKDFSIPIMVSDLVALPSVLVTGELGLSDLLLILGRRIGIEGAGKRRKRGDSSEDGELDHFFGESFGPTDVFRAWWAVAADIKDASLSVLALRLLLEGTLGVGAAWDCILDAARSKAMDPTEAWFYGAELLRELDNVRFEEAPDREAKQGLLNRFTEKVRLELDAIAPNPKSDRWVTAICDFYSGAKG